MRTLQVATAWRYGLVRQTLHHWWSEKNEDERVVFALVVGTVLAAVAWAFGIEVARTPAMLERARELGVIR